MARKIHRKSSSLFRKDYRILKAIGTILLAAALVLGGYFGADFLMNHMPVDTDPSSDVSSDPAPTSPTEPSAPTSDVPSSTEEPTVTSSALRAVYLPLTVLRDRTTREEVCTQALAHGINAVVFDIKDADGTLWYEFSSPLAQQSKAVSKEAMTREELTELLAYFHDNQLTAVGRVYAFEDHTAPHTLLSARITLNTDPTCTWLDNSPQNGGKAWLNPYAPQAHAYLTELAAELASLDMPAVLLEGVQFPAQRSRAGYGTSELSSLTWPEVLSAFVAEFTQAAGEHCRVIQSMPGLSVIGDQTDVYGGNPATFGAATIAPVLMPSTLGRSLSADEVTLTDLEAKPYETVHMAAELVKLRLALMDDPHRPAVIPWVQVERYEPAQVEQQLTALTEVFGTDVSYILYQADGAYRW